MPTTELEPKAEFLLSQSGRMIWQSCHKKWEWAFEKRLTPNVAAEPLVMGSVGHSAWDLNALGRTEEAKVYLGRTGQLTLVDALDHFNKVSSALPYQYQLKEFRTAFKIQIHEDSEAKVFVVGELDGLGTITKPVLGGEWVIERKFTRQLPTNVTRRFLLDDQGHMYLYAKMRQLIQAEVRFRADHPTEQVPFTAWPAGLLVEVIRDTKYPAVIREAFPLNSFPYGDDPIRFMDKFEDELVTVYEEIMWARKRGKFVETKKACQMMGECWFYKLCAEPDTAGQHPTVYGYKIREKSHEQDVVERIAQNAESNAS